MIKLYPVKISEDVFKNLRGYGDEGGRDHRKASETWVDKI